MIGLNSVWSIYVFYLILCFDMTEWLRLGYNDMINLIKARLIQADLKEIDREFEEKGFGNLFTIVLFKQALISVADLVDFELTLRTMYREHPQLSLRYRKTLKSLGLLNIFATNLLVISSPNSLRKRWSGVLRCNSI